MTFTDRMFRAFADKTRLRILSLLARRKELCVCDIQDILGQPQPKISRHLAYLRKSKLVRVRRRGTWMHYSLAKPSGAFHKGLIGCLGGCFAVVPVLRKDARALDRRALRKGCRA